MTLSQHAKIKRLAAEHGAASGLLQKWLASLPDTILAELLSVGQQCGAVEAPDAGKLATFIGCLYTILDNETSGDLPLRAQLSYEDLYGRYCPALTYVLGIEQENRSRDSPRLLLPESFKAAIREMPPSNNRAVRK